MFQTTKKHTGVYSSLSAYPPPLTPPNQYIFITLHYITLHYIYNYIDLFKTNYSPYPTQNPSPPSPLRPPTPSSSLTPSPYRCSILFPLHWVYPLLAYYPYYFYHLLQTQRPTKWTVYFLSESRNPWCAVYYP